MPWWPAGEESASTTASVPRTEPASTTGARTPARARTLPAEPTPTARWSITARCVPVPLGTRATLSPPAHPPGGAEVKTCGHWIYSVLFVNIIILASTSSSISNREILLSGQCPLVGVTPGHYRRSVDPALASSSRSLGGGGGGAEPLQPVVQITLHVGQQLGRGLGREGGGGGWRLGGGGGQRSGCIGGCLILTGYEVH